MTPDPEPAGDQAGPAKPSPTVPLRPDGWPDLLSRRPMSSGDRAKIRHALDAGLPGSALTSPGPFLCYLTTAGLDHEPDPRKATRLRGRIHAAARAAAEGRQTTCHSTHSTITIGIRGPDAQERVQPAPPLPGPAHCQAPAGRPATSRADRLCTARQPISGSGLSEKSRPYMTTTRV
ncbi:MAG: hypothetical protein ACRDOE_26370 [Streptosporangiaceae bacterium]